MFIRGNWVFPACKESQVREEWRLSLQALSGRNCLRRIEALEGAGVRQGVAHHPAHFFSFFPLQVIPEVSTTTAGKLVCHLLHGFILWLKT